MPPAELTGVVKETLTDQVQLPRLYLAWLTPALYAPGDAELDVPSGVLDGRQELAALQAARLRPAARAGRDAPSRRRRSYGSFYMIIVTARPSPDPPDAVLERIKTIVDEELEKLRNAPPDAREVERVKNGIEASFLEPDGDDRGEGRSAERLLHVHRQSRLLRRGSSRGIRRFSRTTSRPPCSSGCRRTGGSS